MDTQEGAEDFVSTHAAILATRGGDVIALDVLSVVLGIALSLNERSSSTRSSRGVGAAMADY